MVRESLSQNKSMQNETLGIDGIQPDLHLNRLAPGEMEIPEIRTRYDEALEVTSPVYSETMEW
jgi:hypothetical protein